MSKLPNVKGRIYYISSPVRQENLYAVYETTDRNFWIELAKCNQQEFIKSGTEGNCIEARELIIALPESFTEYEPKALLKIFTEYFKQNYGVECIAALHHNKRKTNYHIHLIFSERKLLDIPTEKIATRNMYYDENGKFSRTKKALLDEDGQLRKGCKVVAKGDVYERDIFTIKDSRFKSESYLDEVKRSYTELINLYVRDDNDKLKVFDRNGAYLPMKKIGKNNPKAAIMESDNEMRTMWNEAVDRALVSGVPETQILDVKRVEITQKASKAIRQSGNHPELFVTLIKMAIVILELMIAKIMKAVISKEDVKEKADKPASTTIEHGIDKVVVTVTDKMDVSNEVEVKPEPPKQSELAAKYNRLVGVDAELKKQNQAIFKKEQGLSDLEEELAELKGWFKGKQRSELEGKIADIQTQISNMKKRLSGIVRPYGYQNVKQFYVEFNASKTEYDAYQRAVSKWNGGANKMHEHISVADKLKAFQEQEKKLEKSRNLTTDKSKDREGR